MSSDLYGDLEGKPGAAELAQQLNDAGVVAWWERDGTTDSFNLVLTFASGRTFVVYPDEYGRFPEIRETM